MAVLRKPVPKWADTVYGGNEAAWSDAKDQCLRTLRGWAEAGQYGTYTELVTEITAISWPDGAHTHDGRQVGLLLGQVALDELDPTEDRPMITALVVSKEENLPSFGFWNLCADLGLEIGQSWEARQAFWVTELQSCWRHYKAADQS